MQKLKSGNVKRWPHEELLKVLTVVSGATLDDTCLKVIKLSLSSYQSSLKTSSLLLDQIPDFDLSPQVAERAEQNQIAKVVEIDGISDGISKVEDRVALKIEQRGLGGQVAVNYDKLIRLWAPGDGVDRSFGACN